MRTYILQKDLPNLKAGASFVFEEKKDCMLAHYFCGEGKIGVTYLPEEVESNPEWFKEKREENKPNAKVNSNLWIADFMFIQFNLSIEGKPDTSPIKISTARLAEILIAESKGELFMDNPKDRTERGKRYTEKELLEAEEKSFNAAREWICRNGLCSLTEAVPKSQVHYKTFSDYKNEIK